MTEIIDAHAHLGDLLYPNGGELIEKKGVTRENRLDVMGFFEWLGAIDAVSGIEGRRLGLHLRDFLLRTPSNVGKASIGVIACCDAPFAALLVRDGGSFESQADDVVKALFFCGVDCFVVPFRCEEVIAFNLSEFSLDEELLVLVVVGSCGSELVQLHFVGVDLFAVGGPCLVIDGRFECDEYECAIEVEL